MSHLNFAFQLLPFLFFTPIVQSICTTGCDLAFGSYYILPGNTNLASISQFLDTNTSDILKYNRITIPNSPDSDLPSFTRINIPFTCDCINGDFLAHVFEYEFRSVDIYEIVAEERYANLTTRDWIKRLNNYDENRVPDGAMINVAVNCSCGDGSVSKGYGLFVTYPLRVGESLESVSAAANVSAELVRSYNRGVDFSRGSGLAYIPARDENGNYPPLKTRSSGQDQDFGNRLIGRWNCRKIGSNRKVRKENRKASKISQIAYMVVWPVWGRCCCKPAANMKEDRQYIRSRVLNRGKTVILR